MTVERVDLPSGGWAELRDPKYVTNAERQPVFAARMLRPPGEPNEVALQDLTRAMMVLLIGRWEVTGPGGAKLVPPREDPAVLDEISGVDYDWLHDYLLLNGYWMKLFPRFDPDVRPDSPFGSSTASSNGDGASRSTSERPSPSSGSASGISSPGSGGPSAT